MRGIELEKPDACESCGETDFYPNWLPEGQCYCVECACEYWEEDWENVCDCEDWDEEE